MSDLEVLESELFHAPNINPERLKKWVAALESGEYEQTEGVLKEYHEGEVLGHCCIGAYAEAVCGIKLEEADYLEDKFNTSDLPDAAPKEDKEFFNCVGTFFAGANDGGASFQEIADVIKRVLL